MAGEYSREFSARVFNGQSCLIELGFRQGGPAGYVWNFCALQRSGSATSSYSGRRSGLSANSPRPGGDGYVRLKVLTIDSLAAAA